MYSPFVALFQYVWFSIIFDFKPVHFLFHRRAVSVGTLFSLRLPYLMPLFFPPQSVRDFVTLTLLHLIPALLALLEADKRNWHIYTTTSNTESDHDEVCGSEIQSRIGLPTVIRVSNTPPPRSSVDLPAPGTSHPFVTGKQFSEASSSLDEDTFYSIVSPLLNALSQFLCGQPVQLRTQPIPEHFGILDQITELLTNTTDEPQWEDFEKVTRCIADCLVLRSLCDALSSLFHGRYKLSTAAVIEPSQLHTNTDMYVFVWIEGYACDYCRLIRTCNYFATESSYANVICCCYINWCHTCRRKSWVFVRLRIE